MQPATLRDLWRTESWRTLRVPLSPFADRRGARFRTRAMPAVLSGSPALRFLLLQRRQVVAEILDALSYRNFVIVVQGAEDWPPYGHVGRAMRDDTRAETEHVKDVLVGEFPAVALGERG